jgi:CO/xanthine dehydrogenase Mo-binding subunit
MASGPYKIDNLRVDSVAAATNQPFSSAFRGFGGPQACIAYEQQMDEIAKALEMDPLEVRRINYLKTGDRNGTSQVMESAVWLEETATRALEALGEKTANHGPIQHGWGLASYFQSYGRMTWTHDTSSAWVGLEMDGTVVVRCGTPDLGAGQTNSLCQITSEYLGVSLDQITIYSMDSALTPLAGTSTATRQLYMSGNAVAMAAGALRRNLLERAQKHFEEQRDKLDLADSLVFVKNNPKESLPLADLVALCARDGVELSNLAMFKAPFTEGMDTETGQGRVFPDFTFGSLAVEVAVDTETGELTLVKCAACHDIGRAINRAALEGQIVGGCIQGLGYAMMEEFVLKDGIPQTPSLTEYLVPTSVDFPSIQAIILESGTGLGPFGAKGIGEPSLTPAPAAVANAVADAIGTRVFSLPLTPEKILNALDQLEAEKSRSG